ncbi:hypothetical protein [Xanthomonas vasicola]|uniref:hypothetical protein n=1 Tax=Xanthomonas vasicola TaxID=56459 RepID=UPI0020C2B48C|nr:hypothetical protein [Xanthomonas vasicola]
MAADRAVLLLSSAARSDRVIAAAEATAPFRAGNFAPGLVALAQAFSVAERQLYGSPLTMTREFRLSAMRCYIDGTGIYCDAASAPATTFTSKSLFMGTTPGFPAAVDLNQPAATLEQTSAQLLADQSQQQQAQQEQQKVAMGGRRSFNDGQKRRRPGHWSASLFPHAPRE